MGDAAIARGVPTVFVRRLWYALGELVPAACLVAAGFVTDAAVVVVLVTLSVGVSGISQTGYACTSIDVAPHLAGVWMAFQNTFATLPGIIAPILTAALVNVEGKDDPAHWHTVFFISATISVVGVTAYVLNVRADQDPRLAWADAEEGALSGDFEGVNAKEYTMELLGAEDNMSFGINS